MQNVIDGLVTGFQFLYFLCSPVLNPVFVFIHKYYEATILGITVSFVVSIFIALFVDKKRMKTICVLVTLALTFGALAWWTNPDSGFFYDVYVFSEQYYNQIMSEKKEIEELGDRIAKLNNEFDGCKENLEKYGELCNEYGYTEYIMIYNNYVNMHSNLLEHLDQLESEKSSRVAELNKLINNSPINTTNSSDLDLLSMTE